MPNILNPSLPPLLKYIVETLRTALFKKCNQLFFIEEKKMYISKRRGINWKFIKISYSCFLLTSTLVLVYSYFDFKENVKIKTAISDKIKQGVSVTPFYELPLQEQLDSMNNAIKREASTPFYPKTWVDKDEYYAMLEKSKRAKNKAEAERILKAYWAKQGYGVWLGGGNLVNSDLSINIENANKLKKDTSILLYQYTPSNEIICSKLRLEIHKSPYFKDSISVKIYLQQ